MERTGLWTRVREGLGSMTGSVSAEIRSKAQRIAINRGNLVHYLDPRARAVGAVLRIRSLAPYAAVDDRKRNTNYGAGAQRTKERAGSLYCPGESTEESLGDTRDAAGHFVESHLK